jgi:hypothetical protein
MVNLHPFGGVEDNTMHVEFSLFAFIVNRSPDVERIALSTGLPFVFDETIEIINIDFCVSALGERDSAVNIAVAQQTI